MHNAKRKAARREGVLCYTSKRLVPRRDKGSHSGHTPSTGGSAEIHPAARRLHKAAPYGIRLGYLRRDVRAAEGARLEIVCAG
jgi:hypothetical protein